MMDVVLTELYSVYQAISVNKMNEGSVDQAIQCLPSLLSSSILIESPSANQLPATPSDQCGPCLIVK